MLFLKACLVPESFGVMLVRWFLETQQLGLRYCIAEAIDGVFVETIRSFSVVVCE